MGDILKYSGTATVTRDIDFMATALEGKESLMLVHLMSFPLLQCWPLWCRNFYGFSYGTILGVYLANMYVSIGRLPFKLLNWSRFPDRIGRLVIDGVVDPLAWYSKHNSTKIGFK